MIDPVIRPLNPEDLDDALRLSTVVGWNQQLDDWRMLLRLAPSGAFAAVIDARDARDIRIVGTAIGIDYGGFAWIAMMLVDPAYRGCGLGRRLLEAAMRAVPSDLPIRLDATPLGRPLYQKYGFEDEAKLSRHVAAGTTKSPSQQLANSPNDADIRPLAASDLDVIIEQDREAFGGIRGAVLDWAFHAAPRYAHIARSDDGTTHYCFGRRGRLFDQIGPVVAANDDIALALVAAALASAGDRPVAVDAFDSGAAFTAGLGRRGFSIERPLFRMCRPAAAGVCATGPRAPAFATRHVSLRRGKEFAILGPEFA